MIQGRLALGLLLASCLAWASPEAELSPPSTVPVPQFVTDASLEPQDSFRTLAIQSWSELSASWQRAGGKAASAAPGEIRLTRSREMSPVHNGLSRPGLVEVRQPEPFKISPATRVALRHELVHQLLFVSCPEASTDLLFHEAVSVALSGELQAWAEGSEYQSLPAALRALAGGASLSGTAGRRALARVVEEALPPGSVLPRFLTARVERCGRGASWQPLRLEELGGGATAGADSPGASLVVLSRHSGEVLLEEGEAEKPVPFGSTLKPFLVAGIRDAAPPVLPARETQQWLCGAHLPPHVDARTALLRSCNGYFLDWTTRDPSVTRLGAYGPLLQALGLPRLPVDGAEAIGLKPTLALSPRRLAEAYRVLAADRPEVLQMLSTNAREGTLAGLGLEKAFAGVALKTGTVRDGEERPRLGLIVAVDADRVMVMTRPGVMPRSFAGELARRYAALEATRRSVSSASVQVLGLLPPERVRARCARLGVRLTSAGPVTVEGEARPLVEWLAGGAALCLGAPFEVTSPELSGPPRKYAGTFASSPPPRVTTGDISERARRAREGSRFLFTTTLADYVAGVLDAEDAGVHGAARSALAQVIAHNVHHSRHSPRPVCDTTHCQAFRGTARPSDEDGKTLVRGDLDFKEWLPFSRGGTERWEEARPRTEVERLLGGPVGTLSFQGQSLVLERTEVGPDGPYQVPVTLGCEAVRGPLHLPSCPDRARVVSTQVVFTGHGEGHGLGLDVEAAKKSTADARTLLQQAYGGSP